MMNNFTCVIKTNSKTRKNKRIRGKGQNMSEKNDLVTCDLDKKCKNEGVGSKYVGEHSILIIRQKM